MIRTIQPLMVESFQLPLQHFPNQYSRARTVQVHKITQVSESRVLVAMAEQQPQVHVGAIFRMSLSSNSSTTNSCTVHTRDKSINHKYRHLRHRTSNVQACTTAMIQTPVLRVNSPTRTWAVINARPVRLGANRPHDLVLLVPQASMVNRTMETAIQSLCQVLRAARAHFPLHSPLLLKSRLRKTRRSFRPMCRSVLRACILSFNPFIRKQSAVLVSVTSGELTSRVC